MTSFGSRLRAARIASSLTQRQLADMLGVSDAAISRWESGRDNPSFDLLPDLRAAVRTSLDELLIDDVAKAKALMRATGIAEGRADYRPPDSARAQSSRELGLLMWFRLLSDNKQRAVLDLLKPDRGAATAG